MSTFIAEIPVIYSTYADDWLITCDDETLSAITIAKQSIKQITNYLLYALYIA